MKMLTQKGFSLPEILVALGLMSGVTVITMKMVENQTTNESKIKSLGEVSKTVSIIEGVLANPELCKKMLGGKTRATTSNYGTVLPQLSYPVGGGTLMVLESKNYGSFMLNPGDIQLANQVTSTGNFADLIINFKVRKKTTHQFGDNNDPSNFDVVTRRIPVAVKLSGTTVVSCGPIVSEANNTARRVFCEGLGGATIWDDIEKKCKLKNNSDMKCPDGQVPKRMTSLGYVECVPIANTINLNDVFETTPSSCSSGTNISVEYNSATKKLRIKCN